MIANKTNISMVGTLYAPILAIIGAVRFLRAQRLAGKLLIFYLPITELMTLSPETALPLLHPSKQSADYTLAREWLERAWERAVPGARWKGLAYQVVQKGAKQSISQNCGCLDYAWLEAIEQRIGPALTRRWLSFARGERVLTVELDYLIDSLLHRRAASWMEHLRDVALQVHNGQGLSLSPYSLPEVKEIIKAMAESTSNPLRVILDRNQGTVRMGRALRLLGRYNQSPLRDLIDLLDAVRDRDGLLRIVAQVAEECELAAARTEFMIVPDENDLAYLLDDVEQYGARTIAQMLIVLSALRYPRDSTAAEQPSLTQSVTRDGESIEQED